MAHHGHRFQVPTIPSNALS